MHVCTAHHLRAHFFEFPAKARVARSSLAPHIVRRNLRGSVDLTSGPWVHHDDYSLPVALVPHTFVFRRIVSYRRKWKWHCKFRPLLRSYALEHRSALTLPARVFNLRKLSGALCPVRLMCTVPRETMGMLVINTHGSIFSQGGRLRHRPASRHHHYSGRGQDSQTCTHRWSERPIPEMGF